MCKYICFFVDLGELSVKIQNKMPRQSKNRPLKYALIGMYILLSIITLAYVGVHVTQWWCEKKQSIM